MLQNLLKKTFQRNLVLNTHQIFVRTSDLNTHLNNGKLVNRSLVSSGILRSAETVTPDPPGINDFNAEYIQHYKIQYETKDTVQILIETLRTRFRLNDEEVEKILSDEVVNKTYRKKSLMETLDTLCLEGITKRNFVEYPWLITLDRKTVSEKIKMLKALHGFRDLNDFVPFLRLKVSRLRKLLSSMNRESGCVEYGNRVYYIAKKLDVPASTVTKFLAKRLFVLEIPLEMFKANLQHMINYNVEPLNILKDLWGFRYAPAAVEMRLQRALQAKKDKIMPWMVRCPEPILQRSLQISLDELQVLGNKSSAAEYIGERLGFTAEEAQAIMNKHPQVNTVRVTKIKEVLDYLLDEAQFTRYEVAQVPRILCHSLETTKQRFEELKQYGCRPTSLVIICRSKREYNKFLNHWRNSSNHNKDTEHLESKEEGS